MMEDTKWVKWEPKVEEVPPEGCQYRHSAWVAGKWELWAVTSHNRPLNMLDVKWFAFRIPAPTVQEVRPPWIDPQCKFRWGDRVMDDRGDVFYVINPNDPTNEIWPVLVATTLTATYPYAKRGDVGYGDSRINAYIEKALALYPEDLPKHYDDTQQPVKKPVECWVVKFGMSLFGPYHSKAAAVGDFGPSIEDGDGVLVHMREVLG